MAQKTPPFGPKKAYTKGAPKGRPSKAPGKVSGKNFHKAAGYKAGFDEGRPSHTGKSPRPASGKGTYKPVQPRSYPSDSVPPHRSEGYAEASRDTRPSFRGAQLGTPKAGFGGSRPPRRPSSRGEGLWLYGLHPVRAALENQNRVLKRLVVTARAAEEIGPNLLGRISYEVVEADAVSRLLPPGSVHQGAALSCAPLPQLTLEGVLTESDTRRIVLVLDQLTDPHNVGAILRTAAAFGVSAVVVQDRNAPPESGVLAKAASGALDIVPIVTVVNLSRALEELGEMGFWRIAMAGDGDAPLQEAASEKDIALVMGSEGSGIRRLVREHCDIASYVPIAEAMESLNVSNAAAVALYELRR